MAETDAFADAYEAASEDRFQGQASYVQELLCRFCHYKMAL